MKYFYDSPVNREWTERVEGDFDENYDDENEKDEEGEKEKSRLAFFFLLVFFFLSLSLFRLCCLCCN